MATNTVRRRLAAIERQVCKADAIITFIFDGRDVVLTQAQLAKALLAAQGTCIQPLRAPPVHS